MGRALITSLRKLVVAAAEPILVRIEKKASGPKCMGMRCAGTGLPTRFLLLSNLFMREGRYGRLAGGVHLTRLRVDAFGNCSPNKRGACACCFCVHFLHAETSRPFKERLW